MHKVQIITQQVFNRQVPLVIVQLVTIWYRLKAGTPAAFLSQVLYL